MVARQALPGHVDVLGDDDVAEDGIVSADGEFVVVGAAEVCLDIVGSSVESSVVEYSMATHGQMPLLRWTVAILGRDIRAVRLLRQALEF